MDADDFQDLYKLLRGSRSALVVLDAKALYLDKKMVEAHEKLSYGRGLFYESRSRLLKQDVEKQVDAKAKDAAKQIKKLKRKQDKLLEILKGFDELLPALEKLATREQEKLAKKESKSIDHGAEEVNDSPPEPLASDVTVTRPTKVSEEFIDAYANAVGDERLDVISERFGFREVQSDEDIRSDALYYIQTSDQSLLVRTPASDEMTETFTLVSAIDDQPIKRFSREAFLKLGRRRKMVLLTEQRTSDQTKTETEVKDEGANQPVEENEQSILDMGAFSQLLTAAQRSGLVPGADQIAHVRDREFRMGNYDLAFQAIDGIYARFSASSIQRAQQLSREDTDISTGKIKISPKDLLAKRARDRMQTQEIDRANRRFQVVVEGLRVLMKTL